MAWGLRFDGPKLRIFASSVGALALAWSTASGCSRPEPFASATARAPTYAQGQKLELLRSELGARRARPQELQLLPTPGGPLDDGLDDADRPIAQNGLCPPDMASIDDRYCIDRYEASLVEILPNGDERPWSPYEALDRHVTGGRLPFVRAVSVEGSVPQAYISEVQAQAACLRSGKRLCKAAEWKRACMGPAKTKYPYGNANEPGRCNDHGRSPMAVVFGLGGGTNPRLWTPHMNDPKLDRLAGTVAKTGSHAGCTNDYGVYDMVGNVHEWVDDPDGTFLGGFYLDTHQLGDGCNYRTPGHDVYYHDYSTGFRCCADVAQ